LGSALCPGDLLDEGQAPDEFADSSVDCIVKPLRFVSSAGFTGLLRIVVSTSTFSATLS
jgi:hypothetical protein